MVCRTVQMWSLSGLVAGFLDLAIAYLLLCASAVAYVASKFLDFFGLSLPCPCEGMFLNVHSKSLCLNTLLVDFPAQKVSDVQLSVKQSFPFDGCKHDDTVGGGGSYVNGIVEIDEDVASCSSVSDARMPLDVVRREMKSRGGKYDVKGKGQISQRVRSRLRKRKEVGGGYGHYSSVVSCDDPLFGVVGASSMTVDSGETLDIEYDDNNAHPKMEMRAINISSDENVDIKRSILSNGEPPSNPQCIQSSDGDEKIALKILEQTLEEERVARAALSVELEKERNAAATAAEEAMAMILRLQAEKASIEMEARQYQRMIEEKSAYDAEEMIILKEILVRREKEKHFLEKEVEAYRQMVSVGNEQYNSYDSDKSDDPVLLLRQLSASVDKKVEMVNKCLDDVISRDKPNESLIQCKDEKTEQMSVYDRTENKIDLQEKDFVSVDNSLQLTSKCLQQCNDTIPLDKEAFLESVNGNMLDKDTRVHDIHIVGDATKSSNDPVSTTSSEVCEKKHVPIEAVTKRIDGDLVTEAEIKRSSSETTIGLPPIGPRGSSVLTGLRRSSSSAMDIEMLKIDSEVGRLRERLKIVQEGREKLNVSVENRERENIQLKLLEDIARQLEEIRQLSGPRKSARQVSLPLQNSKGIRKKRRSRSVSSGRHRSSEG